MNLLFIKRSIIGMGFIILISSYFFFGLDEYLSLESFITYRDFLDQFYLGHTLTTLVIYFSLYVIVTALSLPAATLLTLVGGALFGWSGVLIISFASTIGASIAFIISRYLLKDWVARRFGKRLEYINQGIQKDGAFYLLSLRLIPLLPFFLVNTLMALTSIRMRTYYWVSQLGMLPATVVYVNAGRELGEIHSMTGLVSPSVVIAFALLGVFPLVTKKGLDWYRARRCVDGKI